MSDDLFENSPKREVEKDSVVELKPKKLGDDLTNEVTRFINEKATAKNDECIVCNSHINLVADTHYQVSIPPEEGSAFSGMVMPVFSTVCMNCGFVRLFSETVVRRQIEASKTAEASLGGEDGS